MELFWIAGVWAAWYYNKNCCLLLEAFQHVLPFPMKFFGLQMEDVMSNEQMGSTAYSFHKMPGKGGLLLFMCWVGGLPGKAVTTMYSRTT